jgi:hypothetical protein
MDVFSMEMGIRLSFVKTSEFRYATGHDRLLLTFGNTGLHQLFEDIQHIAIKYVAHE